MENIKNVYKNFTEANDLIGKRVKVVAVSVKAYQEYNLVGCEGGNKNYSSKGDCISVPAYRVRYKNTR